jgi:hypothetical protein
MSGIIFVRTVASTLAASSLAAALGGCASIHSDSVRSLIDIEAAKIQEASAKSKEFVGQTDERNKAYQNSLAALDESAKQIHTQEALWSLVFSSNQNVESKAGIDALAVAYLGGVIYLDGRAGLDQAVRDQFAADFTALSDLSKKISDSWSSLADLQAKIQAYSKQTAIASVDPQFVAALLKQGKVDTAEIDKVLSRSKQFNEGLQAFAKTGLLQGTVLQREQQGVGDFIDLLNNVKK